MLLNRSGTVSWSPGAVCATLSKSSRIGQRSTAPSRPAPLTEEKRNKKKSKVSVQGKLATNQSMESNRVRWFWCQEISAGRPLSIYATWNDDWRDKQCFLQQAEKRNCVHAHGKGRSSRALCRSCHARPAGCGYMSVVTISPTIVWKFLHHLLYLMGHQPNSPTSNV